jgi:hypothetical protein
MSENPADMASDERIRYFQPPRSSEELERAAVRIASVDNPNRHVRWVLAHRRQVGFEASVIQRVEQIVVEHVASSPYSALSEVVPAFALHFAEGLLERRVRGAIHLALELDVETITQKRGVSIARSAIVFA